MKVVKNFLPLIAFFIFFLPACGPRKIEMNLVTPTAMIIPTGASTAIIPTVLSDKPKAEVTPSPVVTVEALATPTTVPTATVQLLSWPSTPIRVDNVNEIHEIARWGLGEVKEIYYTKSGQALVLTSLGLYFYQVEPKKLLTQIPNVDKFIVSPGEKWIAISQENVVEIFDLTTKNSVQRIEYPIPEAIQKRIERYELLKEYIAGMAFSPDATEIAIGYLDGIINLWKIGENAPYASLRNEYLSLIPDDYTLGFLMRYTPDRNYIVIVRKPTFISGRNRLTAWKIPEGTLVSLSDPGNFVDIPDLLPPDPSQIVTIEEEQAFSILSLWDVRDGKRLFKINTGLRWIDTKTLTLSPENQEIRLKGKGADGNLYEQRWSLADGKRLENTKIAETADEKKNGFVDALFEDGHYQTIWSQGDRVGYSQVEFLDNRSFRITLQNRWVTFPSINVKPFDLPAEDIHISYYDFQNESLAWCTPNTLHWKDSSGNIQQIELPNLNPCRGVTISPLKTFAAGWNQDRVVVRNLSTGKVAQYRNLSPYASKIFSVVFSNDEKYVLFLEEAGMTVCRLEPELAQVSRRIGGGISDLKTHLFFLLSNKEFISIYGDDVLSTPRIGNLYNRIVVWDALKLVPTYSLLPPMIQKANLPALFTTFDLSSDESLLATGDDFGYVRIWDFRARKELFSLEFEYKPVSIAFAPDSSGLVVVLADGTIHLLGIK